MIGEGHGAVRLVDTSGNTIQLDTSGRVTIAGGSITASISGDTVIAKVSGETMKIENVTSGIFAVKVVNSGGTMIGIINNNTDTSLVDGNQSFVVAAQMYAHSNSGTAFHRVRVTQSGDATPMSGVGFCLPVNFSGAVATISGNAVTSSGDTYIAKVSGEVVNVSGNVVVAASGLRVVIMNSAGTLTSINASTVDSFAATANGLNTVSYSFAFRENGSGFGRIRLTESGQAAPMSGVGFKLAVDFSGAVATVSGNAVNMAGAVVTAPTWLQITGLSGGTTLTSQACTMVRLMNLSGNGTMLVGGTGTAAPVSGTKGIPLWPGNLSTQGTEMDFHVNNANLLSVVAHTSGNNLAYMTFG